MTQKTVVQLLDFVPHGWRSMEPFLMALCAHLREQDWRTVHVFAGEPGERVRDTLHALHSPYLVSVNPLSRAHANQLGQLLARAQPDVIQTHFLSLFDPALPRIKHHSGARHLVVTDHGSGAVSHKAWPMQGLAWCRGQWAARHVDRLIGVSEFVCRRDAKEVFFPAERIGRIHNGVDVQRFQPVPRWPSADGFHVAYVGQLIAAKGVGTLVHAVHRLNQSGRVVRLDVAGQGPHAPALRELVRQLGLGQQVRFLGQLDAVAHLYAQADVVVVPSEWDEAFGFVAAEAGACGACLLTSDAGGLPEVVGPDGQAGRLFARGQVDSLVKVLGELMAAPDERERMRLAIRARMVSLFSLEHMVTEHAACLLSL